MPKPKKYITRLSEAEVQTLCSILSQKDTHRFIRNRCRILLDMDENHHPPCKESDCAKARGINETTVANIIKRYSNEGLDSILKYRRRDPNTYAHKVNERIEAQVIAAAYSPVPKGHKRWSIRLLEQQTRGLLDKPISCETIRRILKRRGIDLTALNTDSCQTKQM